MNKERRLIRQAVLILATTILAGCTTQPRLSEPDQAFRTTAPYSQHVYADSQTTCLAAQQILEEQGYRIARPEGAAFTGNKNYQPDTDSYIDINFQVLCAPDNQDRDTIVYVSATEDRYAFTIEPKQPHGLSLPSKLFPSPVPPTEEKRTRMNSRTMRSGAFYAPFFKSLEQSLGARPPRRVTSVTDSNTLRDSRKASQQ